jgi:subtilisin-like proprotein convertase family protein
MKTRIILGLLGMLLAAGSARGTLYTDYFTSGSSVGTIPDGSPVGATFTGTFNADPSGSDMVGGLTISLNVSGGYNGNLYAYLVAPNGTMVVLLNHPGTSPGNPFGAAGSGFGSSTPGVYNFTLVDSGSVNIQTAGETAGVPLTGIYSAAGTLANFNGSAVDGNWELFFADEVSGGGTSTLTSWSLDIMAVPEPVNVGLGVFAGLAVLWWWLGICWTRTTDKNKEPGEPETDKRID